MSQTNVLAIDLGASSGRLISGCFDGSKIELTEQFRFSNHPVNLTNSLYWDYLKISQEIKYGISIAEKSLGSIDSLSVDTWGVDYGLIDHRGKVLSAPYCYRDSRTLFHEKKFDELLPPHELFLKTGVQSNNINSILQLFSDIKNNPYLKDEIDTVLFMPNLIEYFLCNNKSNEFTIASTSGMLDINTHQLNKDILDKFGFDKSWFESIQIKGKVLGNIDKSIKNEIGLNSNIKVISGIGHDTASALMSLPIRHADVEHTAFISCGTWSIVGIQTKLPVTTDDAFYSGLTNEGCYNGNNRLLNNITGLWVIQELQNEWSFEGKMISFDTMSKLAIDSGPAKSYIDLNNEVFSTPGNMENKIINFLKETRQILPHNNGELLRIVYESLAINYALTIKNLEKIINHKIESIYMFGGGIQNQLLVQLTAEYTRKPINLGPIEASVMGNVVCQLLTLNVIEEEDRIDILNNSFESNQVFPKGTYDEYKSRMLSFIKQTDIGGKL